MVQIKHANGIYTHYAHMEDGSLKVKTGDTVKQGQVIGIMGSTGNSTGIHLDFEIRTGNGRYRDDVNPLNYVSASNPRPTATSVGSTTGSLLSWLKNIEGGANYIQGNTWIVFDPAGNDNTMNLAYGMVVASYNGADSWYPNIIPGKIHVGDKVPQEKALQIMEIKHKSFHDAIDKACTKYGVTLKQHERDAVFSIIYRLGSSRADAIIKAYSQGSYTGLWNYIKNTYNSSYPIGTKIRLAEEYELFCNGDYSYNPGTYSSPTKYNKYCNDPMSVKK